jgi:F-type H+-transporting ATPase subunit a
VAKPRRLLGCSFPLAIGLIVLLLGLFVVGFLAGPLGKSMFSVNLPGWLSVTKPEPELPTEHVFDLFGFPIANSVVAGWITVVFLVLLVFLITRRTRLVPRRWQMVLEFGLGALLGFCQRVAGEKNGRRFFPIVATIFLFVMFNAWLSLLPGYGSILIENPEGHVVHLLRGANTDINMPLALALVSFVSVLYFGLKSLGIRYLANYFNVGRFLGGFAKLFKGQGRSGRYLHRHYRHFHWPSRTIEHVHPDRQFHLPSFWQYDRGRDTAGNGRLPAAFPVCAAVLRTRAAGWHHPIADLQRSYTGLHDTGRCDPWCRTPLA